MKAFIKWAWQMFHLNHCLFLIDYFSWGANTKFMGICSSVHKTICAYKQTDGQGPLNGRPAGMRQRQKSNACSQVKVAEQPAAYSWNCSRQCKYLKEWLCKSGRDCACNKWAPTAIKYAKTPEKERICIMFRYTNSCILCFQPTKFGHLPASSESSLESLQILWRTQVTNRNSDS